MSPRISSVIPDDVVSLTPTAFRGFMAGHPSGVVVVTTVGADGAPHGLTCSSLCSVSLEPPLLLVCIANGSRTLRAVVSSGMFAVNLLHEDARQAAHTFATNLPNRFGAITWGLTGGARLPRLDRDAHAVAECSVREVVVAGDHTVLIGEACRIESLGPTAPLVYGMRRYLAWSVGELPEHGPELRRVDR
jgi:flavin reductase (DIM6/NTAB) family NADH-FMN oxidoreductase RutF